MNKQLRLGMIITLVASLSSLGMHLYLALHFYQIKLGLAEGKSLCNLNEHFNCDAVALSRFAVLGGIPMAVWGLTTHLVLSLLIGFCWMNLMQNRDRVLRAAFLLSSFIFLMSIVMGTISGLMLKTYCLFCILTYVFSVPIVVGNWLAIRSAANDQNVESWTEVLAGLFGEQKWVLGLLCVIPAGAWLFNSMTLDSYNAGRIDEIIATNVQTWQTNPVKSFNLEQGLVLGPAQEPATMTIVEFADFLCPHCRAAAQPLHDFVLAHPQAKLVFKAWPLDGSCNADITAHGDGIRCSLAGAVYCAEQQQKKGWQTQEYIFAHQMDWSLSGFTNQIQTMVQALGLTEPALSDCMKSSQTHDQIVTLAKEGSGISGTPTIFVNGKHLEGGQIPSFLNAAANTLGL